MAEPAKFLTALSFAPADTHFLSAGPTGPQPGGIL